MSILIRSCTHLGLKGKFIRAKAKLYRRLHMLHVYLSFSTHYLRLRWRRHSVKSQNPSRNFLVINLIEHLGDIVACEPVARYVRQESPNSYVIWCVRGPYRELIDSNSYVDETLVVCCLTEWILLARTRLFDRIIDLHIQEKVCPDCSVPLKKPTGDKQITLENYFAFGNILSTFSRSAGLPSLQEQPRVYLSRSVASHVERLSLPRQFIAIHCSSNETCKDWSNDKWRAFMERAIAMLNVYVVEVGLSSALTGLTPDRYIDLCGKLSILETAEVIRRAMLFVGIDSGPAQMANAVGTQGVILLGHYRAFTRYMPFSGAYSDGTRANIIYGDGPASVITVDQVFRAMEERLRERKAARDRSVSLPECGTPCEMEFNQRP